MSARSKVVFGIFKTKVEAEIAAETLVKKYFLHSDISILLPTGSDAHGFIHTKGSKAPEGAATGASAGAIVGGTLGFFAGAGALLIPGIGPFVAAGPIMGALAGLGIGGAVGGIAGALIGLGLPEFEAKRIEGKVKAGGILISVHADTGGAAIRARQILKESGGMDISTSREVVGRMEDNDVFTEGRWLPPPDRRRSDESDRDLR